MAMVLQQKVIAYADNDRIFYVSIGTDGRFHCRWSNGDLLTEEQMEFYCKQISCVQNSLEILQNFADHGYGRMYYYSTLDTFGTGSNRTKYVKYYYPYGKPPGDRRNCVIRTKPDLY